MAYATPHYATPAPLIALWEPALERFPLHRIDDDLQAAVLPPARDLLLGAVTRPQRHRDELPDDPLLHAVAVEPRLPRCDHVVLGLLVERVRPFLARDRVDLARRHLDGERIRRPVAIEVIVPETQPHRLRLVHRQHHAAVREPLRRDVFREVVDVAERKVAQPRRQRVVGVVVRDPQRALEADRELCSFVDVRK